MGHPPPTRFTLFPDLPIELRRKIWTFALPPNIHRIAQSPGVCYVTSSVFPPTILFQTCRESRSEALHQLKLLQLPEPSSGPCNLRSPQFSYQPGGTQSIHACPPKIPWYFNPQADTLYLPGGSQNHVALQRWLNTDIYTSGFRSVAIDMAWFPSLTAPEDKGLTLGRLVRLFGNVEVVHVIARDLFISKGDLAMHGPWRTDGGNTSFDMLWVTPEKIATPGDLSDDGSSISEHRSLRSRTIIKPEPRTPDAICMKLQQEVVEHVVMEKERFPGNWKVPKVELNYVRVAKKPGGFYPKPRWTEIKEGHPYYRPHPPDSVRELRGRRRWNWPPTLFRFVSIRWWTTLITQKLKDQLPNLYIWKR